MKLATIALVLLAAVLLGRPGAGVSAAAVNKDHQDQDERKLFLFGGDECAAEVSCDVHSGKPVCSRGDSFWANLLGFDTTPTTKCLPSWWLWIHFLFHPEDTCGECFPNCNVDVTIDCVTEKGIPCDNLETPLSMCNVGSDIQYVSFSYTPAECDPSGNSQGVETFCEDSVLPDEGDVIVFCNNNADGADMVVTPGLVPVGGSFTVSNDGDPLPDKLDCVFFAQTGEKNQQVIIDVSGDINLELTDVFGSFTLISCAPDDQEQTCIETLHYDIDIENTGSVEMEIIVADFLFNGGTGSLLPISSLPPVPSLLPVSPNPLPVGQTINLMPKVDVDVCAGGEIYAEILVAATAPNNGDRCQDNEQYNFIV